MTNKNKLLTMLALPGSAVAVTAFINKRIEISAASKNILEEPESFCYRQRFGNIYYTRSGSRKSLLLIHDLGAASSGYEWNQVVSSLSKKYTAYIMDLPGCGCSGKPCPIYTSYLHIQLIVDLVKSEVRHRIDVISTGHSSVLAIVARNDNPKPFDKLLSVNPDNILICNQILGKYAELYKGFLDLPVIGTLLYHIVTNKRTIRESFITQYFYNPYPVRESYVNSYHEAVRLNLSPKPVYASVHCDCIRTNIVNVTKKTDNSIYIIGGAGTDNVEGLLNEYTIYNPAVEYTLLSDTKYLPQLEKSTEFVSTVKMFFS